MSKLERLYLSVSSVDITRAKRHKSSDARDPGDPVAWHGSAGSARKMDRIWWDRVNIIMGRNVSTLLFWFVRKNSEKGGLRSGI
jgi:hypothetical protein